MKSSSIPTLCSLALVAMCTAGVSHWYSIRDFANAIEANIPLIPLSAPLYPQNPPSQPQTPHSPAAAPQLAAQPLPNHASPAVSTQQQEFFQALLQEVKTLRNENLNLRDYMAETNRDLMKLEFRVDTHSESFRPLPTSETPQETTFQDYGFQDSTLSDGPGVLPPRAEPVFPFSDE